MSTAICAPRHGVAKPPGVELSSNVYTAAFARPAIPTKNNPVTSTAKILFFITSSIFKKSRGHLVCFSFDPVISYGATGLASCAW